MAGEYRIARWSSSVVTACFPVSALRYVRAEIAIALWPSAGRMGHPNREFDTRSPDSLPSRLLGIPIADKPRLPTSGRPTTHTLTGCLLAPGVGLEPTTNGLTVRFSAIF